MYRKILFLNVIALFLMGCLLEQQTTVEEPAMPPTEPTVPLAEPTMPAAVNGPSCITPAESDADRCAEIEAAILASVVRIVFHGGFEPGQPVNFRGSTSHATVMSDRYLVTHNHFGGFDMLTLSADNPQGVTGFSLYNAAGATILRNAPVGTFSVAHVEPGTLVLDFGADFFTPLGVSSASFLAGSQYSFAPGTEVAQVDWDAERAYAIWTVVVETSCPAQIPCLKLDNYVMRGASGGGVFWNGYHIGNNWADNTTVTAEHRDFVAACCRVALNTPAVLAAQ